MQTCKFCGQDRPLVKSHIIPRCFYEIKTFRPKVPSILSDSRDLKPRRRPIGIYDTRLFCQICEKKFMSYDDYACKLLLEKRHLRKTLRDVDGQVVADYYESYDYDKLKLFFISVLFRAGLSDDFFFQHVKLGPYVKILKKAIDIGNPLSLDEFAVFLAYYGEVRSGPVFFPPDTQRIEGVKFYHLHLGRVVFYIKVDKGLTPADLMPFILKPVTKLFLIRLKLRGSDAHYVINRIMDNPDNKRYFST